MAGLDDSLNLSPSPPGQGQGPAAAAYLAGPAAAGAGPGAGPLPAAGAAGGSPEHPFPRAEYPGAPGPAARMDRQDRARYRRDALGNAMVDPHSIERLAKARDPGADLLLREKGKVKESPFLQGSMPDKVKELIRSIEFSRESYQPAAPRINMRTLLDILTRKAGIPAYLAPTSPLPAVGSPRDAGTWPSDYKLYLEGSGTAIPQLLIYRRVHRAGTTYDALLIAVISVGPGDELYMATPDNRDSFYVVPVDMLDPMYGGRRRRRTRRLTKASRYPRSGTRSRAHRRVRG
jgi:hypothetical protein